MFIAELVIVGVTVAEGAELLLLMLMVHPCKYPNENFGAFEGNAATVCW